MIPTVVKMERNAQEKSSHLITDSRNAVSEKRRVSELPCGVGLVVIELEVADTVAVL